MWKNKPKQYKVDRIDWGKLFVMWMTDKELISNIQRTFTNLCLKNSNCSVLSSWTLYI